MNWIDLSLRHLLKGNSSWPFMDIKGAVGYVPLPGGGHKFTVSPSKLGALKGAAAGAALGSVIPVLGTTAGAIIGGTIGFVFGPSD